MLYLYYLNNVNMLYYDRIDSIHKASTSKDCDICHYLYF